MTPDGPVDAVQRFLDAVVWGEHSTVWKLLSPAGRDIVLAAGGRRGLDAVHAERIRQGTASVEEMDTFLTGLIQGLRIDFSSVDLEAVRPVPPPTTDDAVELTVELVCPATFGDGEWPSGSIVVSMVGDAWLVDRVIPVVVRNE